MLHKNTMVFLGVFFFVQFLFSQENKAKSDSTSVYENIQNYSKRNKFTKVVHKLIFKKINSDQIKSQVLPQQNYAEFEGKIIRKITIHTLDPFGEIINDSTQKPRNWIENNGNSIHVKTKQVTIRNVLLFKKNKPLDSLLIKESIRLIRSQRYINKVEFTPRLVGKNSDSVDVSIRVIDDWSLLPRGSISSSSSNFQLSERNFLGTGHTFNTRYKTRFDDGKVGTDLEYIVPNIANTFIQTKLKYFLDLDDNYGKSLNIDRPFYSPFAKWAGGISFDQQFRKDTLADTNLIYFPQHFKYNSQDLWAATAFRISKINTENNRVTNLIVSARFLNLQYVESPSSTYDPINFYSGEQFFLSGIGISTRKFVQDKYIFQNGRTEDIPIGKVYGITSGYQTKNNEGRFYLGGRISFGNFYKWGFLSTNFELGTFFDKSVTEQTAFSFQANYFTNLINVGRWKIRQFIKPQVVIGVNRKNSIGDKLTINDDNGIRGFRSALYGNQKAMLTFQTQTYSPWDLYGFRLNPFFNFTLATLTDEANTKQLYQSKVYSQIGIGLLITNDYLVFNSFQLSFAYYPTIPDNGSNIIKTNSIISSDFGFQNFELDKPRTVIYK